MTIRNRTFTGRVTILRRMMYWQWCNLTLSRRFWATKLCLRASKISKNACFSKIWISFLKSCEPAGLFYSIKSRFDLILNSKNRAPSYGSLDLLPLWSWTLPSLKDTNADRYFQERLGCSVSRNKNWESVVKEGTGVSYKSFRTFSNKICTSNL